MFFVISGIQVFKLKTNVRLKGPYYGCWLQNLTYVGKDPTQKDYKHVFSYCNLSLFEWEVGWSCLTLTAAQVRPLTPVSRAWCKANNNVLSLPSSLFRACHCIQLPMACSSHEFPEKRRRTRVFWVLSLAFKDWLAKENTFVIWKNVVLFCKLTMKMASWDVSGLFPNDLCHTVFKHGFTDAVPKNCGNLNQFCLVGGHFC